MKRLSMVLAMMLLPGAVLAADLMPLTRLAGANKAEIAAMLGKPGKCERIKQGEKCAYSKDLYEIVFINGAADWITINDPSLPFGAAALPKLGLKPVTPGFANNAVLRWNSDLYEAAAQGPDGATELIPLESISVHGSPGQVDFVFIKVLTK